jgi:hypothetical protein
MTTTVFEPQNRRVSGANRNLANVEIWLAPPLPDEGQPQRQYPQPRTNSRRDADRHPRPEAAVWEFEQYSLELAYQDKQKNMGFLKFD